MDNNNNLIYQKQLELNIPDRVVVVGIGGVGTWVALLLAMSGVKEIHLFDRDTLEASNLNRLPYRLEDIGQAKVELVAQVIHQIRPDTLVFAHTQNADERTLLAAYAGNRYNILFDCTDRFETQKFLVCWCQEKLVGYIRIGYDGLWMTIDDKVSAWTSDDPNLRQGYQTAPSWVVPCLVAAALGVYKGLHQPSLTVYNQIGRLYGKTI